MLPVMCMRVCVWQIGLQQEVLIDISSVLHSSEGSCRYYHTHSLARAGPAAEQAARCFIDESCRWPGGFTSAESFQIKARQKGLLKNSPQLKHTVFAAEIALL